MSTGVDRSYISPWGVKSTEKSCKTYVLFFKIPCFQESFGYWTALPPKKKKASLSPSSSPLFFFGGGAPINISGAVVSRTYYVWHCARAVACRRSIDMFPWLAFCCCTGWPTRAHSPCPPTSTRGQRSWAIHSLPQPGSSSLFCIYLLPVFITHHMFSSQRIM